METPQPKKERRFLTVTLIYALGDLLTKGARFILIPYYIQVLTQAEIGMLAVLQAISLACWFLLGGGWSVGVQRFYMSHDDRGEDFISTLWFTRLLIGLPLGLALAGVGLACGVSVLNISGWLIAMAIMSGCLRGGSNIIEAWLMIRKEPVKQRSFTFLQFITITVLIIVCVSGLKMGVWGVFVGELIGYAFWSLLTGGWMLRIGKVDWSLPQWREMYKHCAPMLPHLLFMWGLASIDRLILKQFVTLEELGSYEVGYMAAAVLSVMALSMRAAWLPDYFRNAENAAGQAKYTKTATFYVATISLCTAGLILFAPELIYLITLGNPNYAGVSSIMRIVVIGIYCQSLFMAFNQPIIYAGRLSRLAKVSGGSLVINVLMNYWLIPLYGTTGAAIATVIAYCFAAVAIFAVVQQSDSFQWEYRKFAAIFASVVFFAILGINLTIENQILAIFARCLLLLLNSLMLLKILQINLTLGRSRNAKLRLEGVHE